jgi:hypothetical protein
MVCPSKENWILLPFSKVPKIGCSSMRMVACPISSDDVFGSFYALDVPTTDIVDWLIG